MVAELAEFLRLKDTGGVVMQLLCAVEVSTFLTGLMESHADFRATFRNHEIVVEFPVVVPPHATDSTLFRCHLGSFLREGLQLFDTLVSHMEA